MAWTTDSYQTICSGQTAGPDRWVNTWSWLRADPGADLSLLELRVAQFYGAIEQYLNVTWNCEVIRIKNLGTGVYQDQPQLSLAGTNITGPLPPQVAVRASLKANPNINGGPFLAGWATDTVDADGALDSVAQADIADAIETLQNDALADDWVLCIARPTLEVMIAAEQGRVGQRFDVIRKRSNDQPENYEVRAL